MTLLSRLSQQVGSKELARNLLKKRGHMTKDGELTAEGRRRESMGREGRAINRAAKRSGRKESSYKYNSKTNQAVLKRSK